MKRAMRPMLGLLLGLGVSLGVAGAGSAQELPTGAGRVVENVQMRIFISTASLNTRVGRIQENHPLPGSAAPAP
jgi:hypothetical protein